MAWTDADLKIFSAGLLIGGKWNHVNGKETIPPAESGIGFGISTLIMTSNNPLELTNVFENTAIVDRSETDALSFGFETTTLI